MHINELNISAFGKIKNQTVNFKNGLNLIYGSNESGKTTILAFIKFIFYGMNLHKKTGELSFKEKYLPWDGSAASGSLSFTDDNGQNYIISRFFSKDKSKVNIINAFTGEEIKNIDIKQLGKHFLGLGDEAFSSTAFLSDLTSKVKTDKDGELIKRLTNISESGIESISYKNAVEKLKEEIAAISSERRKNAVIPGLKTEIEEIEDKILKLNKQFSRCDELKEKIKFLNFEIENKNQELNKYVFKSFLDKAASENSVVRNLLNEISVLEKSEFLKYKSVSPEEIEIINDYSKDNVNNIWFYIFGCIGLIAFLSGSFLNKNILLTLLGIGIFFGNIILKVHSANKIRNYAKEIFEKYNIFSKDEFLNGVKICENICSKIDMLKEELKLLDVNAGKTDFNVIECKNVSNDFTIQEINDKINILTKEIDCLKREVILNEEELELCLHAEIKAKELETEKKMLQNKLDIAEQRHRALNMSCEILQKAFGELKKEFAPQLAQKTASVMSEITGGKYKEILADEDFTIKMKSDYNFNSSLFYSRGTYEQLYFAMRIALLNIAVYDKRLPLFLDDAFGFYDDDRFINVLRFVFKESQKRQVFISSCRSNEYMFFRNQEVNIIELCSERND